MNLFLSEFALGRQRCRQWIPLITQQLRLRHVYQIIGFNLQTDSSNGSFYFTLHLTTMCSPFYTSEKKNSFNPKWTELDLKNVNTSSSSIVIRIWQENKENDKIVLTWGVNFSGLVYIGNKPADVHPQYFKSNSVIFFMQGGYFTSHEYIRTDPQKPVPFVKNLNIVDTINDKVLYRRIAIKTQRGEIQDSYNLEKLRKLHSLQLQIKNKSIDVQNIKDKINSKNDSKKEIEEMHCANVSNTIRYAPQLLTMNSLNKMLHEKPTKVQRQKMAQIRQDIEIARFKMRLLSQERDKKCAAIRHLKQKQMNLVDENEERNSVLMENYYQLNKDSEKLKEYKRSFLQHMELYNHVYAQLQHRRRQLIQGLLFIYPITKDDVESENENDYRIRCIHLPNSDVLEDCSETGLSVALGYITHILTMCSIFLQVPLRYPMTHCGSRSFVTDHISPYFPDKGKDFPLFARGKDRFQFSYAVYLLNKNIAHLRWFTYYMNTPYLKSTLPNLLEFLRGRESRHEIPAKNLPIPSESFVSLSSFASTSNIRDPILECIRKENKISRSNSPDKSQIKKPTDKGVHGNKDHPKGLSEIMGIPEAFLNQQITCESFKKGLYDRCSRRQQEETNICDNTEPIEQGTDPLATDQSTKDLSKSKSIKIHSATQLRRISDETLKQNKRLSRSVGSYTEDECSFLRTSFELGSEPLLNVSCDTNGTVNCVRDQSPKEDGGHKEQEYLEPWLCPNLEFSSEHLYTDEVSSPLTTRTDKLLSTKSFNLVKPKP